MDAKLVGIHTATKRLATGTVRAYAYTGRNGDLLCSADGRNKEQAYKRLKERLGTAEILSKLDAKRGIRRPPTKTIETLVVGYRSSPEYAALSKATKRAYLFYLEAFREEFGHYSLVLFEKRAEPISDTLDWRDQRWKNKPAAMDHCIRSISAMFAWGRMRGVTTAMPFSRVARVHRPNRSELIWSDQDIERLCEQASKNVSGVVRFTAETGLRQADVLSLAWGDLHLDDTTPHLVRRTGKTRRQVVVPLTSTAIKVLSETPTVSPVVFTNAYGKPWTPDGFRSSFGRAYRKAKLSGLDFHDLRGTAITRLVLLGVESADIARMVGWGFDQVEALLRVYVGPTKRDVDMLSRIKQKRDSTNQ